MRSRQQHSLCVSDSCLWRKHVPSACLLLLPLLVGARRYLLRIETSNPDLYAALHPDSMSWQRRVDCLYALKDVGYMVGESLHHGACDVC